MLFSTIWRIRVMQGHLTQPRNITKLVFTSLGIVGLALSGIPLVSLDMMASLLLLGFAYKTIEVIQQRDGMVVIFTGFVLVGVTFLYSQSMFTALYGFLSLLILTTAMIAIHKNKSSVAFKSKKMAFMSSFRPAIIMLLLCLPLMILLFMVAPRFTPLWTMSLPGGHAKTGITDRMTPGDIAKLSQSDELAFRVKFLNGKPKQSELYWRGLILQHFDGATWTQFKEDLDSEAVRQRLEKPVIDIVSRLQLKGSNRQYEVIYEKSSQPWLFSLTPVIDVKGNATLGSDFRVMANHDLFEPLLLTMTSLPEAVRDIELLPSVRQSALQLPEKGNIKTHQLAEQLLASSSSQQDYIQKVLNRYKQQEFYYTLRPPKLNRTDSIDEFMINHKKGFCAHYAGSFVYMMRAAGIPARVVAGYQGGEWNESGNYLAVHQYDAHAWTEVWLKDKGWVRIDPTAMVAPERIEKSLEFAMKSEGSFLQGKFFSSAKYKWLNSLRKKFDSGQYAWRRFVLGYDSDAQSSLMKKIFGEISLLKMAMIMAGIFIVVILFWSVLLGIGKKHHHEAQEHRLYRRFCDLFTKWGMEREVSQTAGEFSELAIAHSPHLKHEISAFTDTYNQICYTDSDENTKDLLVKQLKNLLKKIRNN